MFKKETHIELSDGDTCIVANAECPLTEKRARELDIIIEVDDMEVPCCNCSAYFNKDTNMNISCPYYFGYVKSKDKEVFDCRINLEQ